MEFSRLLPLSALFCLALLGSHVQASLPAEDYWQTLWPNTPMPKVFKDILVQPSVDWRTRRTQQAATSSKVKVPSGLFYLHHCDRHNKKSQNTIDKTIPFYPSSQNIIDKTIPFYPSSIDDKESDHNKESQNTIDKTIPFYPSSQNTIDKTIPFYPSSISGKESDHNKESQNIIDKTIPFYPLSQNTIDKTIPFYPSSQKTIDKTIPFYPSSINDKESQNTIDKTIPFYPSSQNTIDKTIPFYPSSQSTIDKTIPFYPSSQNTIDKTIPFYPSSINNKESEHNKKSQNTIDKIIPFYPSGQNKIDKTIPFYPSHIHGKESNTKRDDLMGKKLIVPNGTFFSDEHDLFPGKKVILGHIVSSDDFTFLPDKIAKTIPFSSNKIPEILNRLNIEADSADAKLIEKSLEHCENPAMNGEEKYCATSLESLVDFAVSKLGRNIRPLSTEFERETQDRQYIVAAEGAKIIGEKGMVCHKMDYPYAVFYCHKVKTRTYSVPLVARNDGTRVKAIAVCHPDTASWSPDYIAFKMLNTKPGSTLCHFLSTDTVIWVPQFSSLLKYNM